MDYPLLDLPIDLVEDCEHSHRIAGQPSIMKKNSLTGSLERIGIALE